MFDFVLSSAAEMMVEKVISLAADEAVVPLWGYEKDLKRLRGSVEMTAAVLQDAEEKQSESTAVKLWLRNLKKSMEEADQVLDEIHYEMLRVKAEATSTRYGFFEKVSSSVVNAVTFRFRMTDKIKDINARFSEINRQASEFGLRRAEVVTPRRRLNGERETHPFLDKFRIIGRDDEAAKLVELLIGSGDARGLTVVPIVGMGGLGKTTLAKMIYNDERVGAHFDQTVWVCVSVDIDVKCVLAEILKCCDPTEKNCEKESKQSVIRKLRENLGEKRYLLVLDDVWNLQGRIRGQWDEFLSDMSAVNGGGGSSILITTRSLEVTSVTKSSAEHRLLRLSDDQCWSIIEERAFAGGEPSKTEEMVDVGIEIAKRCGGVPLAARVIGGMMRSKQKRQDWWSLQTNPVWDKEGQDRVLGILKLSFDNLPNQLKQCFAYCSIFEKDSIMEKNELIELWMALGFFRAEETTGKDLEDVGEEFFDILVENSLFQDVRKDPLDADAYTCVMHDLVHDLSLAVSKSECFNLKALKSNDISSEVRHVAVHYGESERVFSELQEKGRDRYLHSLFWSGYGRCIHDNIIVKFKCLRVLKLEGSGLIGLQSLPDSVSELIHLRYLDLSSNYSLKVLPKSMGKLYHLQTIRIKWCDRLKEIPNELNSLVSLRHLHVHKPCKLPLEVGKLTCLRTLGFFHVGREKGRRIEELACLANLHGKLMLLQLEEVNSTEEAKRANLVGKPSLSTMAYVWSDCREDGNLKDKDVLEGLQAAPNLKSLKIHGFMGDTFPEWTMKMSVMSMEGKRLPLHNLVDIELYGCRRCKHVPMLGQLPLLRSLLLWNLENVEVIDGSFYGGDHSTHGGTSSSGNKKVVAFPALETFKIRGMRRLEVWSDVNERTRAGGGGGDDGNVAFPRLHEFEVEDCSISALPVEAFRGVNLSLKRLSLLVCPNLRILPVCLSGLECLEIGPMSKDPRVLKHGLQQLLPPHSTPRLPALRFLALYGHPEWESVTEEVQHLTALTSITLFHFESVEALPEWFGNLTSLEKLTLSNCTKLKSLPSMEAMGRLTRLQKICIFSCPLLKERVAGGSGPEWPKITRIPHRHIS